MRSTTRRGFRGALSAALLLPLALSALIASCKGTQNVPEAEAKADIDWLSQNGTTEAVAALGRLADTDPKALAALEARAGRDVNAYIAAWGAITRNVAWGTQFIRKGLSTPDRAELTASALPRGEPKLAAFVPDLEGAIDRLSAGRRGVAVAGVLASIGGEAHDAVERRLVDPKTRAAMCDALGLPDASPQARAVLLSVKPEYRDSPACVANVSTMATTDDATLTWLAKSAEPGLLTAVAKGPLPCPRVATVWQRALVERPTASHAALAVPLQLAVRRCGRELDAPLAELLAKAPGSRGCILQSIDPFSADLREMKQTCKALAQGWARGESARVRERASDAVTHGCVR